MQMKQNAQQVRHKFLTLIMAGVAGAGFAAAAVAAETGTGINANVDAGATFSAPGTAQAGGAADAHMSTSGNANSNAQWQSGATRGEDRAAERMNTHSTELRQSAGADLADVDKATTQRKR
jgi:hypothetical protein